LFVVVSGQEVMTREEHELFEKDRSRAHDAWARSQSRIQRRGPRYYEGEEDCALVSFELEVWIIACCFGLTVCCYGEDSGGE
jgi:hypothetical protein